MGHDDGGTGPPRAWQDGKRGQTRTGSGERDPGLPWAGRLRLSASTPERQEPSMPPVRAIVPPPTVPATTNDGPGAPTHPAGPRRPPAARTAPVVRSIPVVRSTPAVRTRRRERPRAPGRSSRPLSRALPPAAALAAPERFPRRLRGLSPRSPDPVRNPGARDPRRVRQRDRVSYRRGRYPARALGQTRRRVGSRSTAPGPREVPIDRVVEVRAQPAAEPQMRER